MRQKPVDIGPNVWVPCTWEPGVDYIRRFPRRITPAKLRDENGTLLCICGRPGKHFVHIVRKVYRGFCSQDCIDTYRRIRGTQG